MTGTRDELEFVKERLRQFLENPFFEGFIYLCILYNICTMAMNDIYAQWYNYETIIRLDSITDTVVLSIFTLEAALKILAYGTGHKPANEGKPLAMAESQPGSVSEEKIKAIRDAFDMFDADGGGSIDEFEMRIAMRALGISRSRKEVKSLFEAADIDGSGQLEFDEFKDIMIVKMSEERLIDGYFVSNWNRLDFIIVCVCWVVFIIAAIDQQASAEAGRIAKILRLFRPLRALRNLEGPMDVLRVIPASRSSMTNLLVLFSFVLFIYAILGINLYGIDGHFYGKCVVSSDNSLAASWDQRLYGFVPSNLTSKQPTFGELQIPLTVCSSSGWGCEEEVFECSCKPPLDNLSDISYVRDHPGCARSPTSSLSHPDNNGAPQLPFFGFLGFSNFPLAVLTIFSTTSLSNWNMTLQYAMQGFNSTVGWLFFISMIILARFWILNLAMAVMATAYREVRDRRREIQKERAQIRAETLLVKKLQKEQKISAVKEGDEGINIESRKFAKILEVIKLKLDKSKLSEIDEQNFEDLYNFFDEKTKDGIVSKEDFHHCMQRLRVNVTEDEVKEVFALAECATEGFLTQEGLRRLVHLVFSQEDKKKLIEEQNFFWMFGLIPVSNLYLHKNKIPFTRLPLLIARAIAAPRALDECGELVPLEIVEKLEQLHLRATFGPRAGAWKVAAGTGGSKITVSADKANGASVSPLSSAPGQITLMEGEMVPGGTGISITDQREDMYQFLNMFQPAGMQEDTSTRWRRALGHFRVSSYFDVAFMFVIVLNFFIMATEHFDGSVVMDCEDEAICPQHLLIMNSTNRELIAMSDIFFTCLYSVEVLLRITAAGSLLRYVLPIQNRLDLLLVLIALLQLSLPGNFLQLYVLRIVRLLRITRVVAKFRRLRLLFWKVALSLSPILHVIAVLCFAMFMVALLGMQLWMCPVRPSSCTEQEQDASRQCPVFEESCFYDIHCPLYSYCSFKPYINFNTFWSSFFTTFVMLTGDDWTGIMYAAMRIYNNPLGAAVFFAAVYSFLAYILLNCFIAVIIENFEMTDEEKVSNQLAAYRIKVLNEMHKKQQSSKKRRQLIMQDTSEVDQALDAEPVSHALDVLNEDFKVKAYEYEEEEVVIFGCLAPPTPNSSCPEAPRNLRGWARDIYDNKWFENTIICCITVGTVCLALDSPIMKYSLLDPAFFGKADIALFVIYTIEFVLKVLHHGVYWEHKEAYFRSVWNILDFIVLLCQTADVSGLINGISAMKAARVLRPIRLLSKISSLQRLLAAVGSSATDFASVGILALFLLTSFSVLGVNMFAGKLDLCNDDSPGVRTVYMSVPCEKNETFDAPPGLSVSTIVCDGNARRRFAPPINTRWECSGIFLSYDNSNSYYVYKGDQTEILKPRVWRSPAWSFDNFFSAAQTLFEILSLENWTEIAQSLVECQGIGLQPTYQFSRWNWFFVAAFIVAEAFMVLPLVVGVVVDNIKRKSGAVISTDLQNNWTLFEKKIADLKPIRHHIQLKSQIQTFAWNITRSPYFNQLILSTIICNMVAMASDHYNPSEGWSLALGYLNWLFFGVYWFEICVKLLAFRSRFWASRWNIFDFLVVTGSTIEQVYSSRRGSSPVQTLRGLRLIKILRAFRVVKRFARLNLMIRALIASIPAIASSFVFLTLFIFLFAVLGNQFLTEIKQGYGIGRSVNFNTTWNAMLLLFQAATGGGFRALLWDSSVEQPACTICSQCIKNSKGVWEDYNDCGNRIFAVIFFDAFYLIVTFVLLNLFVAVLLDNFLTFTAETKFVLKPHDLQTFRKCWSEVVGTQEKIPIWKLRGLLERLHYHHCPLGTCALADQIRFRSIRIELLDGNAEGTDLHFQDVVYTLSLNVAGSKALRFEEMMKRQEKLAFYSRLALVSKLTNLFGKKKHVFQVQHDMLQEAKKQHLAIQFALTPSARRQRTLIYNILNGCLEIYSSDDRMAMEKKWERAEERVFIDDVVEMWEAQQEVDENDEKHNISIRVRGRTSQVLLDFKDQGRLRQFFEVARFILNYISSAMENEDEDEDEDNALVSPRNQPDRREIILEALQQNEFLEELEFRYVASQASSDLDVCVQDILKLKQD